MDIHADDWQWGNLVAAGAAIAKDIAEGRFDPQIVEALPEALARLKTGPNPGNRVVVMEDS